MTLHLHRGTGTGVLADGLAALLATPLADPFAEEVVVVPAKGVERWLTQRLSHRLGAGPRGSDGICAGVRFLNPRSLVALLTGTERDDPWDPDRLVWPLLDVVDASLDEPWCRTLALHLGHGADGDLGELRRDRRYSVVRRLAGLLTSYAVAAAVPAGRLGGGPDTDGAGADLPGDLTWQAELWRRLVAEVRLRHRSSGTPRRWPRSASGADLPLPDRLSMFGHTRLPVTELELLRAVGEVREVHLWLPQASPAAWDRIAADLSAADRPAAAAGPVRRVDDARGPRRDAPAAVLAGPRLPRAAALAVPARPGRGRSPVGRAGRRWSSPRDPPPPAPGRPARRPRPGPRRRARRDPAAHARPRRPVGPGARLPRRDPPGRGAAGGPGRADGGLRGHRRPAGATRHPRDVPRRRGLRPAVLRRLRAG